MAFSSALMSVHFQGAFFTFVSLLWGRGEATTVQRRPRRGSSGVLSTVEQPSAEEDDDAVDSGTEDGCVADGGSDSNKPRDSETLAAAAASLHLPLTRNERVLAGSSCEATIGFLRSDGVWIP